MDAKQLRNSILQMAIQGKLVPQDPNDEPASVLLDKIRQEKKRLVKEGVLKKKDLEGIPVTEDEKPFEIPKGWVWCRIGDVFTMQAGKNVPTGSIKKEQNQDNPYPCMGGNGIRGFVPNYNIEGVHAVMGRQGALCGNINLSPAIFYATEHAVVISNYAGTDLMWTYYSLTASNFNQYATATAQPGLSVANILKVLYPLPPLAEQHRIVAKLEEILPMVDEYGKAQEEANKLQEELPDKLRKSILQEAIQGKLVPQGPNDEPASILLDKIRQEKKHLVKEGKLKKKELEEIPISEDEKPFEIPDSWVWCRIGDVFTMQAGKNVPTGSIKKEQNQDNPYPCMGGNGIRGFVPNYNIEGVHAIMGRQGALCGNINLSPEKSYATEHAVVISNYAGTDIMWTYYSLTASNLNQYATATAQPGLSVANILRVLYPLPPLTEQHRIVAKIEELFNQINKIYE